MQKTPDDYMGLDGINLLNIKITNDAVMVQTIIGLAKIFRLNVIAEGV